MSDLHARAFSRALDSIEALADDAHNPRLRALLPREEAPAPAALPEDAPPAEGDDDLARLAELYAAEGG